MSQQDYANEDHTNINVRLIPCNERNDYLVDVSGTIAPRSGDCAWIEYVPGQVPIDKQNNRYILNGTPYSLTCDIPKMRNTEGVFWTSLNEAGTSEKYRFSKVTSSDSVISMDSIRSYYKNIYTNILSTIRLNKTELYSGNSEIVLLLSEPEPSTLYPVDMDDYVYDTENLLKQLFEMLSQIPVHVVYAYSIQPMNQKGVFNFACKKITNEHVQGCVNFHMGYHLDHDNRRPFSNHYNKILISLSKVKGVFFPLSSDGGISFSSTKHVVLLEEKIHERKSHKKISISFVARISDPSAKMMCKVFMDNHKIHGQIVTPHVSIPSHPDLPLLSILCDAVQKNTIDSYTDMILSVHRQGIKVENPVLSRLIRDKIMKSMNHLFQKNTQGPPLSHPPLVRNITNVV